VTLSRSTKRLCLAAGVLITVALALRVWAGRWDTGPPVREPGQPGSVVPDLALRGSTGEQVILKSLLLPQRATAFVVSEAPGNPLARQCVQTLCSGAPGIRVVQIVEESRKEAVPAAKNIEGAHLLLTDPDGSFRKACGGQEGTFVALLSRTGVILYLGAGLRGARSAAVTWRAYAKRPNPAASPQACVPGSACCPRAPGA